MSPRHESERASDANVPERIRAALERFEPGVHRLGEPAFLLDAALPDALAAVYRCFDGAEMFHESIVLVPSSQVARETVDAEDRWRIGEIDGDDLFVDSAGQVWRFETDTSEWLEDGSRLDRWLLGMVEAEAMLYELDGEFVEDMFDENGELLASASERMLRRVLKRDRVAPAPRWRLAQALLRQDKLSSAREQLEEVVQLRPGFAWAWFDLARISEKLGSLQDALDEVRTAAEAHPDYEYAGFFWAHAARLAAAMDDEAQRAACAAEALARAPDFVAAQREGAVANLEEGELEAALALAELAAALAPRDLMVCDLLARIRQRLAGESAPSDD